jgi:UDP-galactopyranose mutase
MHDNRTFTLPVNLGTLDKFFGQAFSPTSAKELIESKKSSGAGSDNFEDHALSLMGSELYEAFFKHYTKKQWQVDPRKLPNSILSRLPFRFNFNTRYFNDKHEGLPIDGYFALISNLANHANINIHLRTDFFDQKSRILELDKPVVYTGPLDRYFDYSEGVLGWRTLDFEFEIHDVEDFQGCAVMNYADLEPAYTRIHEFKHLHPERARTSKTIIAKEFSRIATSEDSPYYPINSVEDRDSLARYRSLSELENGVLFGGRLGSYMYLDMHMAIAAAMSDFENKLRGQLI